MKAEPSTQWWINTAPYGREVERVEKWRGQNFCGQAENSVEVELNRWHDMYFKDVVRLMLKIWYVSPLVFFIFLCSQPYRREMQ